MADFAKVMLMPEHFLPVVGEPELPFRVWFSLYEQYLEWQDKGKDGAHKLQDADKNSLLFSLLSKEGLCRLGSIPVTMKRRDTSFALGSAAIKEEFCKLVNLTRAHVEFQRRKQQPGELVSEFLTRFWSLAADCNFDGREDYYLAIQLAAGCREKDSQAKMLQKMEPNLEEMVQIMEADELAQDDQMVIRGQESSVNVHKVKFYRKQQQGSTTGKEKFQKGAKGPSENFGTGC